MNEECSIEEIVVTVEANLCGVIRVLEDLKAPAPPDARLYAAIAALEHTRSLIDPVLDA